MKTIFITGASAGLGKATAKLFHAQGWRIIATMRTPEKETELGQLDNVVLLPLDVIIPAQITATVQQALALGDIDVVFNNAGHGLIGALEAYTDDQMLGHFETNVLGVLRVARDFTHTLRPGAPACSSPPLRCAGWPRTRSPRSTTRANGPWKAGVRACPMTWRSSTSASKPWRQAASSPRSSRPCKWRRTPPTTS